MTISNQQLAHFLRSIPQSNQDPCTLGNIANTALSESDHSYIFGYLQSLRAFGIIQIHENGTAHGTKIQATSQTAKYALMSIADYVERDETIITDWKTRGVQDSPLANGATFLHALENERVRRFAPTTPSRYVKVAQGLIKRVNSDTGNHELLMQFDKNANQYQLIGGRWSEADGEDLKVTMIREIEEELPRNHLPYATAYQLRLLIDDLAVEGTISATFGALTHYSFWVYHMYALTQPLELMPEDLWVPIQQIHAGVVEHAGKAYPFTSPEMYQRIEAALPGGLMGLSSSFVDE